MHIRPHRRFLRCYNTAHRRTLCLDPAKTGSRRIKPAASAKPALLGSSARGCARLLGSHCFSRVPAVPAMTRPVTRAVVRPCPCPLSCPSPPGRRGQPGSGPSLTPLGRGVAEDSQGLDWLPQATDGRCLPGSCFPPPGAPLFRPGPRLAGPAPRPAPGGVRGRAERSAGETARWPKSVQRGDGEGVGAWLRTASRGPFRSPPSWARENTCASTRPHLVSREATSAMTTIPQALQCASRSPGDRLWSEQTPAGRVLSGGDGLFPLSTRERAIVTLRRVSAG